MGPSLLAWPPYSQDSAFLAFRQPSQPLPSQQGPLPLGTALADTTPVQNAGPCPPDLLAAPLTLPSTERKAICQAMGTSQSSHKGRLGQGRAGGSWAGLPAPPLA